jgi:hypothetical protein
MALPGLVPQLSSLGQTVTQAEQPFVATADTITNAVTAPNGLKVPASQVTTGLSSGITSISSPSVGGILSSAVKGLTSLGGASGAAGILNSAIGTAQTLGGLTQSVVGAAAALGLNVGAIGQISQSILGLNTTGAANPSFQLTPQFTYALQTTSTLVYPLDLPLNGNGMRFGMYFKTYQRNSAVQVADYNTNNAIYFPMPDQLQENHSVQWDTFSPGPLKAGLASAAIKALNSVDSSSITKAAASAPNALGTFNEAVAKQLTSLMKQPAEMTAGVVGALSDVLGSDVTGLTSNYLGIIPNPASTVMLKGVKLRNHQFSWTFAPRSSDESAQLENILNVIRANILPTVTDDKFFLGYPSVCFPRFEPNSNTLYDFKPCVVTDLQIDHAGAGEPSFFFDTLNPTIVKVTISFQEIEMKVNGNANILNSANGSTGQISTAPQGSSPGGLTNDDEQNVLTPPAAPTPSIPSNIPDAFDF